MGVLPVHSLRVRRGFVLVHALQRHVEVSGGRHVRDAALQGHGAAGLAEERPKPGDFEPKLRAKLKHTARHVIGYWVHYSRCDQETSVSNAVDDVVDIDDDVANIG